MTATVDSTDTERMIEFFAARLAEEDIRHRHGTGPQIADVGARRWVFEQWTSLRADADDLRRTGFGGEDLDLAAQFDGLAAFYEPVIRIYVRGWARHPDYDPVFG